MPFIISNEQLQAIMLTTAEVFKLCGSAPMLVQRVQEIVGHEYKEVRFVAYVPCRREYGEHHHSDPCLALSALLEKVNLESGC